MSYLCIVDNENKSYYYVIDYLYIGKHDVIIVYCIMNNRNIGGDK